MLPFFRFTFFNVLHIFSYSPLLSQWLRSAIFAGQTCCLVQFFAPHCPQRLSPNFMFDCPVSFMDFGDWILQPIISSVVLSCTCCIPLPELLESFNRSYMCSCITLVMVSIVRLLYRIFFKICNHGLTFRMKIRIWML